MAGFQNILVVHDNRLGGDDALAQAVAIAAGSEARLTVAVPVDPSLPRTPQAIQELRARVGRLKPWIVQQGAADVRISVLEGTPHVDVVRRVLDDDHDLVVICDAGSSSVWQRLWPSTTEQLLRHCPCPIFQARPGQAIPGRSVLAAIDFDNGHTAALARRIIAAAAACAEALSARLHVVHCWEAERSEREMLLSEISDAARRDIIGRNEEWYRAAIRALLDESGIGGEASVQLPRGTFPECAIAVAKQQNIDVIVVGCRRRDPVTRSSVAAFPGCVRDFFPGSVLAVKPEQFQTPVVQAAMEAVGVRLGRR